MLNPISLLSFGIVLDKDIKEERIVLRADRCHQHYLRKLSLHPSQRKYTLLMNMQISNCISDRHTTSVWVTKSWCNDRVLEPQSLRHQLHDYIKDMWEIYEND